MQFEGTRIKTFLAWGWQLPAPPPRFPRAPLWMTQSLPREVRGEKFESLKDSTMTILFLSIQTRLLPLVTKAPHCKGKEIISSTFLRRHEIQASVPPLTLVPDRSGAHGGAPPRTQPSPHPGQEQGGRMEFHLLRDRLLVTSATGLK